MSVRFGLILEAYCRGSPEHVKILNRQMDFMEKLRSSNEQIRKRKDKDKMRSFVQEHFREPHCAETFYLVCNPLDPSFKCKRIKYVECHFTLLILKNYSSHRHYLLKFYNYFTIRV